MFARDPHVMLALARCHAAELAAEAERKRLITAARQAGRTDSMPSRWRQLVAAVRRWRSRIDAWMDTGERACESRTANQG